MFATAALAADVVATLDLADHTEVRARSTINVGAPPAGAQPANAPPGIDLLTQPEVNLRATSRRWRLTLSYSASIVAPDIKTGFTPQVVQIGAASASWHDRRWSLLLSEDGSYGVQNSAFLLPTQATLPGQPPVQTAAPPPTNILFASSHTMGTVVDRVDRRTTLTLTAEYTRSGGLDSASQAVLPLHYGPGASATVDYLASRIDHLVTAATAQRFDFTQATCPAPAGQTTTQLCQIGGELAQVEETWRHAFSRTATAAIGVGAAATGTRLNPGDAYGVTVRPVADASYRELFGAHVAPSTFTVFARLAPLFDPLTGAILNAVQGEASVLHPVTRAASLRFAAGAFQNVPPSAAAATSSFRGEVSLEYVLGPQAVFSMGERGFWQDRNGSAAFVSAFGFVAVTVRERTLHF
jgi:hypothetical protein